MDETPKITPEQWEAWRQYILSKRQLGQLMLVIYDPQSNRSIHMSLPADFANFAPQLKAEAYALPALRQLGF